MSKVAIFIALLTVSSIGLSGCLTPNKGEQSATPTPMEVVTETPTPTSTPEPTSGAEANDTEADVEITVDSGNFKFTPNVIEAKPGETIKVTLNNLEGFHDLVIDELNVATQKINGAGTDEVTFTIPADTMSGTTYEYYCSVGNHRAMGMSGVLKIS